MDAKQMEFWVTIIGLIIAVLAGDRGIHALDRWRRNRSARKNGDPDWSNEPTDVRSMPVSRETCQQTRDSIKDELKKGSEKMEVQSKAVQEVRETVIKIDGAIQTLGSEMKLYTEKAAEKKVNKHEKVFHPSGRRSSSSNPKP